MLAHKLCVLVPSQISSVKDYEEEAKIAYAALLDIEGKTEEAIATLETINNMSSIWHLAQVSHTLLQNITGIFPHFPTELKNGCLFLTSGFHRCAPKKIYVYRTTLFSVMAALIQQFLTKQESCIANNHY